MIIIVVLHYMVTQHAITQKVICDYVWRAFEEACATEAWDSGAGHFSCTSQDRLIVDLIRTNFEFSFLQNVTWVHRLRREGDFRIHVSQ